MKCPECQTVFPLTWTRYFRAPWGRMDCPSCGVRLALKHRWFYWPAMALGGILLCFPLSVLAYRLTGSLVVTLVAAASGWILSGVPADLWLEERFAILRPVARAKTGVGKTLPAPGENHPKEPEKEQEQP